MTTRSERADQLVHLLGRGPRTWTELADAGLSRAAALRAVGDVVARGDVRIRVGPILLEIEPSGEGE